MQLAMIVPGRMGANMVRRLRRPSRAETTPLRHPKHHELCGHEEKAAAMQGGA
jgi:hypothetical protein